MRPIVLERVDWDDDAQALGRMLGLPGVRVRMRVNENNVVWLEGVTGRFVGMLPLKDAEVLVDRVRNRITWRSK